MRKLLIPLLAALALPTAVNAESYWLVLTMGSLSGKTGIAAMEKIEVVSWDFCNQQGQDWANAWGPNSYWCIVGK